MAIQSTILMPRLREEIGTNLDVMRPVIPASATNTFLQNALVKNVSGELKVCVTAETLVWGQAPCPSFPSGTRPPTSMFGNSVWAWDLSKAQLEINTGKANGTDVTIGTSTTNSPGAVTVGTAYGILVPTTGTYAGVPFLDPTNTTNLVFRVAGFKPGVDPTDYNGRLFVTLVPAALQ